MKCVNCGQNINLMNLDSYSIRNEKDKLIITCNNCNDKHKKIKTLKTVSIKKDRPYGIWIFAFIIIILNLYYWYPVYSGNWESINLIFDFSPFMIFFWFNIILVLIEIYAVTIGFYNAKKWARYYEIGYLSYSSFWAIMSMFVIRWQVIEHYLYFLIYVILIVYLFLTPIKRYFGYKVI